MSHQGHSIRKSVKDLSKAFTSVEQAVEKNQEIIHEIRRSTSSRGNVSPKIKEMLEKEKERLTQQSEHDSRVRRLKKRGSEIVERRNSGTFTLGSDGSVMNMKTQLEEEGEKIRQEEEEKKRLMEDKNDEDLTGSQDMLNVNKEPPVEDDLTGSRDMLNVKNEPPVEDKNVETPVEESVKVVEKTVVVEPKVNVVEEILVEEVPKKMNVEVVHEPPQPTPKVEPVKLVREEIPIPTKQVVVEPLPLPKTLVEKPVETQPQQVKPVEKPVERPVEPEIVKVVKQEPQHAPQPTPQPTKHVETVVVEQQQPPIQTKRQVVEEVQRPKPVEKPVERPVETQPPQVKPVEKPVERPVETQPRQVEPKPEIVREEPKPKKTKRTNTVSQVDLQVNQPVIVKEKQQTKNIEISEENYLKNMESINLITQMSDIDTIEINSDSDLANYIVQSINKAFEPFWEEYLRKFDPTKFIAAGKVGWDSKDDTPKRMVAREPINRMKNIESIHLSRLPFTTGITDLIHEKVSEKISGVARQLIRGGVRKHIRLMLQDFIYRNYS